MAPLFATCRHRPGASFAMALSGDCVARRKYRSDGIKCREMIRVVLTDEAYDAIASTLPKGTARWRMQRDRGQSVIQVEAAVVDRMMAMPGPARATGMSSQARRTRGGAEVGMRLPPKMRSDRRGAADGARVEAPRRAREEPL